MTQILGKRTFSEVEETSKLATREQLFGQFTNHQQQQQEKTYSREREQQEHFKRFDAREQVPPVCESEVEPAENAGEEEEGEGDGGGAVGEGDGEAAEKPDEEVIVSASDDEECIDPEKAQMDFEKAMNAPTEIDVVVEKFESRSRFMSSLSLTEDETKE